jgi:RNA polymerase sigma-70 factor (ECF subfamily)
LRYGAEGVILLLTTMLDRDARDSWQVLGQRLGAYIGRRLPAQDVDDVLQDVLLRIHKNVRYLGDDSRFGPWVYSVARNAVIDRLRKKQPVSGDIDVDSVASSTSEDDEQALLGCVTPFVARLPQAYRHAITLVELQGLSQADAAAIEGVSLSGMKSRVQRGRRMLREMFEECCALTIDARGRVIEADRHDQSTCGPSCAEPCDDGQPVTPTNGQDSSAVRWP